MSDFDIASLRFTPPTHPTTESPKGVGRPNTPREQLVVPSNPRAIENRPIHSAGRIPISASTPTSEQEVGLPFDTEAIEREVKLSTEYQALKGAGLIKEDDETDIPAAPAEGETPAETIELSEFRYQRVEIRFELRQELHVEIRQQANPVPAEPTPRRSDPLALDLNGNGLETTGTTNGVQFDIDADGQIDQTSFVSGGDAFLALDINNNGRIDDGRELFGDQNGDTNGYLALAHHDDNGDGRIDQQDAVFQRLRLFTQSSNGEQQLRSLSEEGIASLNLSYRNSNIALNRYDSITQLSSFEREDGSEGVTGDLLLGYKTQS